MGSRCRGEVMIAAMIVARKSFVRADCRGASISECFWCRVRGWSPWTTLPLERGAPAIAFDVHLDDGGVVNEAIDGGERHSRIREDPVPLSKGLIGGDQHGTPLVASADELEQHAGLGLVLGDVGKIIADQEVARSRRLMAASRLSSRRATWSFWTRSVVRVKRTRHPFSIRARPMAAAK